jgi:hypothetical protein
LKLVLAFGASSPRDPSALAAESAHISASAAPMIQKMRRESPRDNTPLNVVVTLGE